ncbi:allantoin permease [Lachnospiraceae bacterium]|jgi:cytosine permease|nr:cytosine permease [uncultured Schaedlerella sp.]EOS35928.1 NCS1 nucleoside transporter [Lachnospiraceae bacterium M18-1]MCI9154404.1 allantoin permease [Ruminococcus sp.]NBI61184.1 allantoin permease [Lachnospiraceae bacterium]
MEKNQTQQQDTEFSLSAVPESERKSYFSLTIVWTGFVFVITSMMAGGGLSAGLDFKMILVAVLLGNVFLSAIAILVSIIASKTGLTFALMTRYSFGEKGSRIASMFVPIVNIGWYTIQAATYGHFIAQAFGLGDIAELICMAVSAVVMGIFAMKGIKAISILGYIAIPAIIFLSLATSIRAVGMIGLDGLWNYTPEGHITLSSGITVVIGTWILSTSTCIADIMRYARSTKEAIAATLTGLLGGNIFMILCGTITSVAVGDSDLTNVLLSMGLLVPCLILMTTNIFTTNASNLYSTSLNLSNAFHMDRQKIIVVLLAISALATLCRPYQVGFLFSFLDLLGTIVPPLPGIILADYFIIHKGEYKDLGSVKFAQFNAVSWLTWAIALAGVYLIPFGLPALKGLIIGGVLYPILMKVTKKQVAE